METIKFFSEKLFSAKSVALFCHVRPDGDTIGSAFALMLALKNSGVKAQVFCSELIPEKYFYALKGFNAKQQLDGEYELFISIDCGDLDRLGDFAFDFNAHKNTFNLDHHISNRGYAKFNCVIDNAANAENVYNLLVESNVEIDQDIANLLALGIVTDTGNFKHKNVTESTFKTAASLKALGADFNKTVYENFTKQSKNRAKLLGICMSKLRYLLEDRLCVLTVTENDLKVSNAKRDETEGFIDLVMGIDCVEVGVSVMEVGTESYKISFRSKGTDVNEIAGVFGGGGHVLASGCRLNGCLEEVIDKVRYAVKQHLKD
ncbi:MAG: bifunctional oligoribonuclease/PAP phosphatase NrnA [Clostridia bacterium]|nr:bifunctional oligoribonuclease/PAP phosphatase NrnA [Clostridia bacterium]